MKEIKLKSIDLINFKGIRNLHIDFNINGITSICGRNATGKSTIIDAFLWLLFDKNKDGDSNFGIKTNDEKGYPIPKLSHEVSAVICVNGDDTHLRKCLVENWSKKNAINEDVFTGNTNKYFINDVPKKAGEYSLFVKELCDEIVFKTITNPLYLPTLKKDELRAFLFKMTEEPSNHNIIGNDDRLKDLTTLLNGKTVNELNEQIKAEKSRIRKELDEIPSRIDECQRNIPESEDWNHIQQELDNCKKSLTDIDAQITDKSQSLEIANKQRLDTMKRISDKKIEIIKEEDNIKECFLAEYNMNKSKQLDLIKKVNDIENECNTLELSIENFRKSNLSLAKDLDDMTAKLHKYRCEWKEINSQSLTFNDEEFICPACKRKLDETDIDNKKQSLISEFNIRKATLLENNQKNGLLIKEEIDSIQKRIESNNKSISDIDTEIKSKREEISQLKSEDLYSAKLNIPDLSEKMQSDKKIKLLKEEIEKLENCISQQIVDSDIDSLKNCKSKILESISSLEKTLAKREVISSINKRISQLNNMKLELSQRLSEKEYVENLIDIFNQKKIEMTESKINSLFAIVRWKMFNKLINGNMEQTCIPMIGKAEYKDANSAAKINGGLDIINAVCQYYGVFAPIFIDNAEGINEILPVNSQIIRLVVTSDNELTVTY